MAILENETSNYFKINFDSCSIKGRAVYVNFSVYKSGNEREKEKEREKNMAKFFSDFRSFIDTKYKLLFIEIGNKQSEELLADADNLIDKDKFPMLRVMQEEVNYLIEYEQSVSHAMYRYGEEENALAIPDSILSQLKELGFLEEWVSEPICISSGAEVYCGEYNDEHLDKQFYYDRLKTVMSQNIVDC